MDNFCGDQQFTDVYYPSVNVQNAAVDTHRNTADRINGLERPKPNEGYALKNGISIDTVPQNEDSVNNQRLEVCFCNLFSRMYQ